MDEEIIEFMIEACDAWEDDLDYDEVGAYFFGGEEDEIDEQE